MCGICGVVTRAPLADADARLVEAMSAALAHRGPDDATAYRAPQVAFGFRRLSIIDLAGGAQPITNEDGSLVLVMNGEVYNYRELRTELLQRGHLLRTQSDVEVFLHLYEERGLEALKALRGMFALALHDVRRGRVLLARDRVGEKPLFVHVAPGRVAFASEQAAFLRAGVVPLELDPVAVDRYFHMLYATEPASVVRDVRQVDAGCWLSVDLASWELREGRWWSMLDAPAIEGDPVTRVREELERVASLVIRADVPVGVALSGGLDSSAVAALAARAHGAGLAAFSVGYEGTPESDERADAAECARQLGLPLHAVALRTDDMVDEFPAMVRERGDPIADIAGFGHRAVMRLAREHGVPVLLTGYGGDELFWGYPWARHAVAATLARRASRARGFPLADYLHLTRLPRLNRVLLAEWLADAAGIRSSLAHRARDRAAPADAPVFYELSHEYPLAARRARGLYGRAFRESLGAHHPSELFRSAATRADLAVMDRLFATFLRSVGFAQGDRLAMAQGVEPRLPLVDAGLVETVVGLHKARPDGSLPEPKAWLREAVRGIVPDVVFARPKRGFTPPVFPWHQALMRRYGALVRDGELVARGVLTPQAAEALAAQEIPAHGWGPLAFCALVLEVWCREMRALAAPRTAA